MHFHDYRSRRRHIFENSRTLEIIRTVRYRIERCIDYIRVPFRTNGLKDPSHVQCEGQKGVMGIHLGLYRAGQIRAGDEVSIG